MLVANYLPKVQAIDKTLALLSELKVGHPSLRAVHIINIHEKSRIANCEMLFALLAKHSVGGVVIGSNDLAQQAIEAFDRNNRPVLQISATEDRWQIVRQAIDGIIRLASGDQSPTERYLFVPFTDDGNGIVTPLMREAKARAFKVFSYFKSVHDHGMGLTHDDGLSLAGTKGSPHAVDFLRARVRRLVQIVKKKILGTRDPRFDEALCDAILAFNSEQQSLLVAKGFDPQRVFSAGYFLLYPSWKQLVRASGYQARFQKSAFDVVVFTRGASRGHPPEDNILNDERLVQVLDDIFRVVSMEAPGATVRIKPHPIQDIAVIERFLVSRSASYDIQPLITYDPPSFLASVCDLAVSTYSSAVIDTLIFDVPSIEYLIENEFFRKKHPKGSPFPSLGVLSANDRQQLQRHVRDIRSGLRPLRVLEERLNHIADLSIFSPARF